MSRNQSDKNGVDMFSIKYILNIYINLLFIIILVMKNNNGTRGPTLIGVNKIFQPPVEGPAGAFAKPEYRVRHG